MKRISQHIKIDEEDMEFIIKHKDEKGTTVQHFVSQAIKNEIKEQQGVKRFLDAVKEENLSKAIKTIK